MAKQKGAKRSSGAHIFDGGILHGTPSEAATELDALLYFIHKNYNDQNGSQLPNLLSFLITKADVVFSKSAKRIYLQKLPKYRTLQIIAPQPDPSEEDERRIYLLDKFGELILKCQKNAYLQIREMILSITDEEGRKLMIDEFNEYRNQLTKKQNKAEK